MGKGKSGGKERKFEKKDTGKLKEKHSRKRNMRIRINGVTLWGKLGKSLSKKNGHLQSLKCLKCRELP